MRNYYCLYDKKTEAFLPLFEQFSDKGCVTTILREIQTADTVFAKFPQDYQIFKVLTQDESTGHIDVKLEMLLDLAEVKHEIGHVEKS